MLKRIVELCWFTSTTGRDVLDWLDKNQLAESESHERATRSVSVFLFQPQTVNEGRPDNIEEQYFVDPSAFASRVLHQSERRC